MKAGVVAQAAVVAPAGGVAPSAGQPSEATVLKHDSTTKKWKKHETKVDLKINVEELPKICYVFLENGDYYKGEDKDHPCDDAVRCRILQAFGAPKFLSSQLCTDLNGYYGSMTSLTSGDDPGKLKDIKTWFRCLTKKVLEGDELKPLNKGDKDYAWYEMGFFTNWSGEDSCRILCIGTPPELREGLEKLLVTAPDTQAPQLQLRDPFALLRPLLDEVVRLYNDHTWRVTKRVRHIEMNRDTRPNFVKLNDLLRHACHLTEVEGVTVETLEHITKRQKEIFGLFPENVLDQTYKTQAGEYLAFQQQMVKSVRWRAVATQERLEGEITLAYNMLANSDNRVMKSITLLTMIFLPGTFISALFSTTFFSFAEGSWDFSPEFWIYWAVALPLTLVLLAIWWLWLGGSYKKIRAKWLEEPV